MSTAEDWEDVDEEDDAAEDAVSDAAPPDGDAEMEAMDVQSEVRRRGPHPCGRNCVLYSYFL